MNISDSFKKVLLAGVGAVATTAESAKGMVDKFVEKGELTVEQGKVLNEELKHKAKDKVKDYVSVDVEVTKNYSDAFDAVDAMSREDLDSLKSKIAEAEANLNTEEEKADENETEPEEKPDTESESEQDQ